MLTYHTFRDKREGMCLDSDKKYQNQADALRNDWDVENVEFLLSLNPEMRAKFFRDIELLSKHGFDSREPNVKPLKGYVMDRSPKQESAHLSKNTKQGVCS